MPGATKLHLKQREERAKNREEMLVMYHEGKRVEEIGEKFGVTGPRVRQILKGNGTMPERRVALPRGGTGGASAERLRFNRTVVHLLDSCDFRGARIAMASKGYKDITIERKISEWENGGRNLFADFRVS